MKFRNKVSLVLIKWSAAFLFPIAFVSYFIGGYDLTDPSDLRSLNKGFCFFVAFSTFYIIEELKKYVLIKDDHVYFNLFKFKKIKFMKNTSFGIRYEDIIGIESNFLPFWGLYSIKINAKNLPEKIKISFCFRKHKKLYVEIIKRAKAVNPDVYIDSKLEEYLEKRGLLE
ncbi:MAG: hypothetical protein IJE19_10325 [Clostridia bacterium]|nr:hypothetical protein [Clostridia bacterium]